MFGNVNAGRGIGGPRAAGHHGDAGASRQARRRIGHHDSSALLPADGDIDRNIVQRVEDCEIAFSRHAEHVINALGGERVDNQLSTGTDWKTRVRHYGHPLSGVWSYLFRSNHDVCAKE